MNNPYLYLISAATQYTFLASILLQWTPLLFLTTLLQCKNLLSRSKTQTLGKILKKSKSAQNGPLGHTSVRVFNSCLFPWKSLAIKTVNKASHFLCILHSGLFSWYFVVQQDDSCTCYFVIFWNLHFSHHFPGLDTQRPERARQLAKQNCAESISCIVRTQSELWLGHMYRPLHLFFVADIICFLFLHFQMLKGRGSAEKAFKLNTLEY